MGKRFTLTALLGATVLLMYVETAQAQFYGGRGGRRGGTSFGFSTPYFSGYYGRGGYGRGYGGGYGYGYGYYGRPYGYGGYYGAPYYSYGSPYYSDGGYYSSGPGYVVESQPGATQSFYAGPQPEPNRAHIRVIVPDPEAKVWFENTATQQRGSDRLFESPQLDEGKEYTYTIRAKWDQDGRDMTRERRVTVRAGETATVNFRARDRDRDTAAEDDADSRDRPRGRVESDEGRDSDRARPARQERADERDVMSGEFVRARQDEIIMTGKDGDKEHGHKLASDVQIMVEGRKATVQDLKPGMKIRVTTRDGEATRIDAEKAGSSDRREGAATNPP